MNGWPLGPEDLKSIRRHDAIRICPKSKVRAIGLNWLARDPFITLDFLPMKRRTFIQCGLAAAIGTPLYAALRQDRLDEAAGRIGAASYEGYHAKDKQLPGSPCCM